MRFVSKSAKLCLGNLRNATEGIGLPETKVINGRTVTSAAEAYILTPSVPINFSQEGLTQADIDAGMAHWKQFPGLPLEDDGVTTVNPVEHGRIGVFDSVEWQAEYELTDDERIAGEKLLLDSSELGVIYILIEEVKAAKPWPSYDDIHHSKIVELAVELGLVERALAYEQENKQRTSVLKGLEAELPVETGEFVSA